MVGPADSAQAYAFGPFRLDARERTLVRDGNRIALRDKVFDTLVVLVAAEGKLVTREQLLDAIWPDTVVEDSNISHNISVLRRTLSRGKDETYIETVPKRGYRFVPSVSRVAAPASESRETTPGTAASRALDCCSWNETYDRLAGLAGDEALAPGDWLPFADAARWSGHFDERITILERGIEANRLAHQPEHAARLAVELAIDHLDRRRTSLAKSCIHEARRLAPQGSDVHCWLAWLDNRLLWESCDWESACTQTRAALAVSREHGCRCVEALCLLDLGHILVALGRYGDAIEPLEQAGAAVLSDELPIYGTGFLFCGLIFAWRACGDLSRAAEWTEASLRWCDRQGISYFPGTCRVHRGELIRWRGWLAEAEQDLENGVEQLTAADSWRAGYGFRELGEVRLRLGDLAGAEEAFQRALELGTQPQPGLARLRAARGDREQAFRDLARLVERTAGSELALLDHENTVYVLPVFVTLAIGAGELDRARKAAERLAEIAAATGSKAHGASAAGALGEVLLAEGRVTEAIERLTESWRAWCLMDAPYESSLYRTKLAEALLRAGDRLGARMELSAAASTFARIGAVLDQDRAQRRVREIEALATETAEVPATAWIEIVEGGALANVLGQEGWAELLGWFERRIRASAASEAPAIDRGTASALLEFDDASEAVRWSRSLQLELRRHRLRTGFAPPVRIGIVERTANADEIAPAVARVGSKGEILATDAICHATLANTESQRRASIMWRDREIQLAAISWCGED